MDIETIAANIVKQAVDLDSNERYTEALVYYQEGLQVLDEKTRGENDEHNKNCLKNKVEECTRRVAVIKELVEKRKEEGKYCEKVHIKEDSTGHGYKKLFGRFLDEKVEKVIIEDTYIRTLDQCQNFLRLCELLVKSCGNLRQIQLKTSLDKENEPYQRGWLYNIKTDLQTYGVQLIVIYCDSPYFSQIILSSGWIIKINRGLDVYRVPINKFSLGVHDLDLRQCHDTKITIVHSNNLERSLELSHSAAERQQQKARATARQQSANRAWLMRPGNRRGYKPVLLATDIDWRLRGDDDDDDDA